jgi:hypothetical protein
MKRSGILLATLLATVFGSALMASRSASAAEVSCWYNDSWHTCVYYPGYSYASPEVTPPLIRAEAWRSILVTPMNMGTPSTLDLGPSQPRLWHQPKPRL